MTVDESKLRYFHFEVIGAEYYSIDRIYIVCDSLLNSAIIKIYLIYHSITSLHAASVRCFSDPTSPCVSSAVSFRFPRPLRGAVAQDTGAVVLEWDNEGGGWVTGGMIVAIKTEDGSLVETQSLDSQVRCKGGCWGERVR